jgi:hypothetical protein
MADVSAAAPKGPFKHTTDGKASLTAIAQSRGMHAGSWLAEQQMTAGKQAADALGNAVPAAGLPWYSNTP